MSILTLALTALAVYRLTHMLVYEAGPLEVFNKLRTLDLIGNALTCHWCTSVWVSAGLVAAYAAGVPGYDWVVLWLALSALSAIAHEHLRG